jgi:hypothetical protein
MYETFCNEETWGPEGMVVKRRFWKEPASLSWGERSPAAEKTAADNEAIDEKEDHRTAMYWG